MKKDNPQTRYQDDGSPGVTVVKNLPAYSGDTGYVGLILGSGSFPRGGNGNPIQYSCLGSSTDRGDLGATIYGVAKRPTCD